MRIAGLIVFMCVTASVYAQQPSMSLIPSAPLKLVRCPRSLAPTLVTLPSMSLIPSAPLQAGAIAA